MKTEIDIFKEGFQKFLHSIGIYLSSKKFVEISEETFLKVKKIKFEEIYQNCVKAVILVTPKKLFKKDLVEAKVEYSNQGGVCPKIIFSPVKSEKEEELVLYWEGEDQAIQGGKNIFEYLRLRGFKTPQQAHSSFLIEAMKELTEERLEEIGIPNNVDIILISFEGSVSLKNKNELFVFMVQRSEGERAFTIKNFTGEFDENCAFLLCPSP